MCVRISAINIFKGDNIMSIKTKERFFKSLMAILLVFAMIFCFASCMEDGKDGKDGKDGEQGADGKDGIDGVGISDVIINSDGELIMILSDGTTKNLGVVKGEDGVDGEDGLDGEDGVDVTNAEINENGELILYFSDGTYKNLGIITDNSGGGGSDDYLDVSYYTGVPDTSWYTAGKTEYHLRSADQLAGLAQLVNAGNKFKGATVYLDCDVIWNDGLFTMTETGDPLYNGETPVGVYEWTPIGTNFGNPTNTYTEANGFPNQFYGNFDGQGHFVSGLYTNNRNRMAGFFTIFYGQYIKNLNIVNSYIGGDSRVGSFFSGCYVTEDFDFGRSVNVRFENLYSDAYVVASRYEKDSRSGGIGGMLRPLGNSDAELLGFAAEFNRCWFDGVVYSVGAAYYNGGLLGVAAYGDKYSNGSYLTFNDCLVTAGMYGNGGHVGLVLGNMYAGSVDFNNVVAVIEDTNLEFPLSSGIISTLEGNNGNDPYASTDVFVSYNNVFAAPAGGLTINSYYFHKVIEGINGIIVGDAVLDNNLEAAASVLNTPGSAFIIMDGFVMLDLFDFELISN